MAKATRRTTRDIPAKTHPEIAGPPRARQTLDVGKLERALRKAVDGEVRFDPGSLGLYAQDASNFRQVPIGVVVPRTLDDVVAVHKICHRFGAPILSRGGGTSLSGETVNEAVVIDHSKYLTGIGEIDPGRRLVTCEPGVINEELNRHTGRHNLVFGPDPSSHSRCVIGGNIGNNSCGIHSVQSQLYGPGPRTSDNVQALEIVTYDGARFWVGVDEEKDLARIIAKGVARERSTLPCANCVTSTPTPSGPVSARRTRCRAACPGTTSTNSCPSAASTSPAPWSAPRAPVPPFCSPSSCSPPPCCSAPPW